MKWHFIPQKEPFNIVSNIVIQTILWFDNRFRTSHQVQRNVHPGGPIHRSVIRSNTSTYCCCQKRLQVRNTCGWMPNKSHRSQIPDVIIHLANKLLEYLNTWIHVPECQTYHKCDWLPTQITHMIDCHTDPTYGWLPHRSQGWVDAK